MFLPLLLLFGPAVPGAQPDSPPAAPQPDPAAVAARVDGEPILVAQLQRELARVLGDRQVEPGALSLLEARTLQQLIDRQLVLNYLTQRGLGASSQELDLAVRRIEKQLQQQELTLEQYLQRSGLDQRQLRHRLAWQLSWTGYLDRYLTDQNLERYFEKHRRQFDGSRVRAAHILWRIESAGDQQALEAALEQAGQVRQEILAGSLSFAEAARRYSSAPTGPQGGELGWIGRRHPMPERFSQAAFALEEGQISPPVISPFGVHLIHCQQIQPGDKSWQQVRQELTRAMTQYLFRWIADRQRPEATIEWTGAVQKPGAD